MIKSADIGIPNDVIEFLVFRIHTIVCGLEIKDIQEIKKVTEITPVHHAPDYIRGVINLRGQIVTIIDVRKRFLFKTEDESHHMRIILVKKDEEFIGLLVDEIEDAVIANREDIQLPPANVNGIQGQFFMGIYQMDTVLVSILDKDMVLNK